MIFTIGRTESYEKNFKLLPNLEKLGRTTDPVLLKELGIKEPYYAGGSVWKTQKEAKKNCPSDYSVYGVVADWKKDTVPTEDGDWNYLLVTSKLIKI
jgi:hypothetical protein